MFLVFYFFLYWQEHISTNWGPNCRGYGNFFHVIFWFLLFNTRSLGLTLFLNFILLLSSQNIFTSRRLLLSLVLCTYFSYKKSRPRIFKISLYFCSLNILSLIFSLFAQKVEITNSLLEIYEILGFLNLVYSTHLLQWIFQICITLSDIIYDKFINTLFTFFLNQLFSFKNS